MMNPDEINFPEDEGDENFDLGPDQLEQTLQQLVQLQAQFAQVIQQIGEMQAHVGQALTQALAQIAQSNQLIADAIQKVSAPRRRVAVRDGEGRITEAHDLPM